MALCREPRCRDVDYGYIRRRLRLLRRTAYLCLTLLSKVSFMQVHSVLVLHQGSASRERVIYGH